ncbi:SF1B family DNA helicase RecD2 [Aquibacillus sediminis]|uniref:SF1B family DNA helicase RecD2 n=1 Tax=Aquibacillus sediminis TaxID=2574734 RepID=UPI00110914E0|nr:ATP-dependent RecD-like DNA helicase [Aquibacillus sediminis]
MEDNNTVRHDGYIKGELIQTIFMNEDEHFCIAKINISETNEQLKGKEIVVKGYFSRLEPGETYVFKGQFENHKKFGQQYQVHQYHRYIPTDEEGLVAYLSSDLFYGIGKKTAKKIIEQLGLNAISKILQDADVLTEVRGLSREKAEQLHKDLKEHQGFEHAVVGLSKYGFGLKMAQKIYQFYKDEALDVLERDPYQYVFDIEGFGFQRADEVAKQNNLPMNHSSRIQAACVYVLQQSIQDGHVFLPLEKHLPLAEQLLQGQKMGISFDNISQEILQLNTEKKVIVEDSNIYLPSLYYAESGFCTQLQRIFAHDMDEEIPAAELLKIVGLIEEEETLSYGKEQYEAIERALRSKVMILTGGPGTGKTTVIKGIIKAYAQIHDQSLDPGDYDDDQVFPFVLTAPTGRAAKRMNESTGLPAVTIHRLLGWNGHESFEKDSENQLSGKLLVIDEFSMVDIWLANQLFKAIPNDMQVLIVGDEDQLPSVGPGQVLADLMASGEIPSVKLEEVYRQKEGSKIIQLAHEIKNNECGNHSLEKEHDFNFIACQEGQVVDVIKQIVERAHSRGIDLRDLQVLAPMYKSTAGIHRINEEIQRLVNPKTKTKREIRFRDTIYRTGDKVIQLVNQPEDGVFNGDIGEIVAIYEEDEAGEQKQQIVVLFDEKEIAFEKKDLNNLMHAYCTSIHKSQGSEFPIVILPVVPGYRRMLRKNLIYTAITRCKKSLILCGNKQAFLNGVREEDTNQRYTNLDQKVSEMFTATIGSPTTNGEEEEQLNSLEEEEIESEEEGEELSPYDFL